MKATSGSADATLAVTTDEGVPSLETDDLVRMLHEMSVQHALFEYVLRHPDQFPDSFVEVFSRRVEEPTSVRRVIYPPGIGSWESLVPPR